MLMYFIGFTILGFVLGVTMREVEKAAPVIIIISILWGLTSAPIWGLATLGELSLGFYIFTMIGQNNNSLVD